MSPPLNDALDAAIVRAQAWLVQAANTDGSWGYRPGQRGCGEATLLAAAAGLAPTLDWLGSADLGWTRLMLPVCLSAQMKDHPLVRDALVHILGHRGTGGETAGSFDGDLPGWPWVEGTFSWVEPTAWALLSLRRCQPDAHAAIEGAEALLADRQCSDGGWNAGTPDILGQPLFGYAYLTGLVLTALPPGHESVAAGLAFLTAGSEGESPLNLAWSTLARAAHGGDPLPSALALAARADGDGGYSGRSDRTALALCALHAAVGQPGPLGRGR